jgi:membrane protease YdiL (CAAX protease family)
MEPENQPVPREVSPTETTEGSAASIAASGQFLTNDSTTPAPEIEASIGPAWFFIGSDGLRAGWSVLVFLVLTTLFAIPLSFVANSIAKDVLHLAKGNFTPTKGLLQEIVVFLALLGASALMALIERRRLLDYNLRGPRRLRSFVGGVAAGFVGLSALVGGLAAGGWLHFGPVALTGAQIISYAALWGTCFVLVGLFEEGMFRCYLQFTLTRGINFWWALAIEAGFCGYLLLRDKGNGVWGVFAFALLGMIPCLLLELKKTEGAGFWQAAWVTSTAFGFIHTGNNGENWIGIFAAAAIGFVFCVSIWVTGSAWWAIGCHAGWDWAETYFYGTADSGLQAQGHLLTTNPVGNALWSGGTDGPEGSVLVLGVILLLLVAVLAIYGRRRVSAVAVPALSGTQG